MRLTNLDETEDDVGDAEKEAYRVAIARARARLVPLFMLVYVFAHIDRTNIGFAAKAGLQSDLAMSDARYGLGSGIFFLGYIFLQIPANMLLREIGARRWLGGIMILWGCVSSSTAFVQTEGQFLFLRFCLGIAESGFVPGVMLYFSFWFVKADRAKAISIFFVASPISGVVSAVFAAAILSQMEGAAGWRGWRWVLLLQGMPAVMLGVFSLLTLPDGPEDAAWLTPQEKRLVCNARLPEVNAADQRLDSSSSRSGGANTSGGAASSCGLVGEAMRDRMLWVLWPLLFVLNMAIYGISMWLPLLMGRLTGVAEGFEADLLCALPPLCATIVVGVIGCKADWFVRQQVQWVPSAVIYSNPYDCCLVPHTVHLFTCITRYSRCPVQCCCVRAGGACSPSAG
jgi:MFS family permease